MAENVGRRGDLWFYRLELPPGPDGRRRQKRVGGFKTEREARRALAKAAVDVQDGRLRYAPTKTVGELATEWLEVVVPNRRPSTARNYQICVQVYIVPRLGSRRLDRLTAVDIHQLYADLRAAGGRGGRPLSGTQVRNVHRVLHNMLAFACRMGYLAVNPADVVDKPRDDSRERVVYTPEQVRQLLVAARDDRLGALWHLVVATGLRRGELAGLRWGDLNLDATPPLLHVRQARTRVGRDVVTVDPKTRAGKRTVVLDPATVEILREHRQRMAAEAEDVGRPGLSTYVFVDEVGEPFNPERITRQLHAFQKAVGLPPITLHDLRHTSATIALLAGVHPKVVTERHGHASTQITLDRYSHVLESMQTSAADAIGRFLEGE
jgi:integrase